MLAAADENRSQDVAEKHPGAVGHSLGPGRAVGHAVELPEPEPKRKGRDDAGDGRDREDDAAHAIHSAPCYY